MQMGRPSGKGEVVLYGSYDDKKSKPYHRSLLGSVQRAFHVFSFDSYSYLRQVFYDSHFIGVGMRHRKIAVCPVSHS